MTLVKKIASAVAAPKAGVRNAAELRGLWRVLRSDAMRGPSASALDDLGAQLRVARLRVPRDQDLGGETGRASALIQKCISGS